MKYAFQWDLSKSWALVRAYEYVWVLFSRFGFTIRIRECFRPYSSYIFFIVEELVE